MKEMYLLLIALLQINSLSPQDKCFYTVASYTYKSLTNYENVRARKIHQDMTNSIRDMKIYSGGGVMVAVYDPSELNLSQNQMKNKISNYSTLLFKFLDYINQVSSMFRCNLSSKDIYDISLPYSYPLIQMSLSLSKYKELEARNIHKKVGKDYVLLLYPISIGDVLRKRGIQRYALQNSENSSQAFHDI